MLSLGDAISTHNFPSSSASIYELYMPSNASLCVCVARTVALDSFIFFPFHFTFHTQRVITRM
jgi:hypothetical protein